VYLKWQRKNIDLAEILNGFVNYLILQSPKSIEDTREIQIRQKITETASHPIEKEAYQDKNVSKFYYTAGRGGRI
tara:strand:+ start:1919 stop:2143 length:225 start_codon:yes stop_codon:yes gene_type:complete